MVRFIESTNTAFNQRKAFTFGIEPLTTNTLVGLVNLESVSWIGQHAAVGLLVIFNSEHGGKSYGSDAMIVLLDMTFSVLDLYMVFL